MTTAGLVPHDQSAAGADHDVLAVVGAAPMDPDPESPKEGRPSWIVVRYKTAGSQWTD